MSKKIILLVAIILILIGLWLYLFFISSAEKKIIPETEEPETVLFEPWDFRAEGYVIFDFEGSDYHIISGKLTEEQVGQLAQTVINDLLTEDPALEKMTLFFYSDLDAFNLGKADVAEIDWAIGKMNIEIK